MGRRTAAPGLLPTPGAAQRSRHPELRGRLGWALLALLERRTARARTVWTAVALTVLVLSVPGPLSSAGTPGAALTLAALHVVVAAVLVPGLRRTGTGPAPRA